MKNAWLKIEKTLFETEYKSWQVFLIYLLLASIIFSPSFLNLNFFWDDERFIFGNPEFLQSPSLLYFWDSNSPFFKSWPLGYSFFWLLIKYFHFESFAFFKFLNIVIHSLNAFFIFKILKELDFKKNFIWGALFLIHPFQVETVSWIFQLLTILALIFFLISFYFLIIYSKTAKWHHLIISLISYAFSIWTKSIALFTPLIFLSVFWLFGIKKKKYLLILPYLFFSLSVGIHNIRGMNKATNQASAPELQFVYKVLNKFDAISLLSTNHLPKVKIKDDNQKLLFDFIYNKEKKRTIFNQNGYKIFMQAPWHYISKIFIPFRLSFIYPEVNYGWVLNVIAVFIVFFVPIIIFFKTQKRFFILLSTLPIVFLLPYLGIVNISFFYWSNVSDRYMYFFLIYFIFSIATAFKYFSKYLKIPIFIFTLSLTLLNFTHGIKFNNPQKLYEEIIEHRQHPIIYSLLFEQYFLKNDEDKARTTLEKGKKLFPDDPQLKDDEFRLKSLIKFHEQM